MTYRPQPKRGEVWWVKPGKTAGAELQKKRPYVVIIADAMGNVPIKIVVPLKTWQDRFADWPWVVRKHPPVCQACHRPIGTCCHCGTPLSLTEEKGVDVAIATDMIKLAWEDAYDWVVLVSSDRDFIPAVEFLNGKGRKVLHAGFPPRGSELAAKCWGSLDLRSHLSGLERT